MKIWEKIVEGVTRLASAEPIGSLLGLASPPPDDGSHPGLRQIGFTIGVIALGAKMAGADGEVSDVEIEAFRRDVDRLREQRIAHYIRLRGGCLLTRLL